MEKFWNPNGNFWYDVYFLTDFNFYAQKYLPDNCPVINLNGPNVFRNFLWYYKKSITNYRVKSGKAKMNHLYLLRFIHIDFNFVSDSFIFNFQINFNWWNGYNNFNLINANIIFSIITFVTCYITSPCTTTVKFLLFCH